MTVKSLSRFVLALVMGLFVWASVPTNALAAAACGGAKSKVMCGKHADCSWSGKACVAKAGKAGAKAAGKAKAKASKPAAAAKKAESKKVEPVPAESDPMDAAPVDEGAGEEAPAEGEEDF